MYRNSIAKARQILTRKLYFEEEITKLTQELIVLKQGNDKEMYDMIRKQIEELNQEKNKLLELIQKQKTMVEEVETNYQSTRKVKASFNKEALYHQIELLQNELRNTREEVIREERVVYKENSRNVEKIVKERPVTKMVEKVIEEHYNKDCICQCNCACHERHCNEHTLHHFREKIPVADEIKKIEVPKPQIIHREP